MINYFKHALVIVLFTSLFASNVFAISNLDGKSKTTDEHKSYLAKAKKKRKFVNFKTPVREVLDDFLEEGTFVPEMFRDSLEALKGYITGLEQKVESENRFVDQLDPQALTGLPVGISKTIGNLKYMIMIDQIRIHPDFAEIDVYMSFIEPKKGKRLNFMGRGIKISKEGGLTGDGRLELIGDFALNENAETQIIFKGGQFGGNTVDKASPTYVLFDCDGYKEMAISVDVLFSKKMVVPENPETGERLNTNLITNFSVTMADWNDLVVSVDLPPFQLTNLEGVGFSVRNAVIDLSDTKNGNGVVFPNEYINKYLGGVNEELWRGVYIEQVEVRLPKGFKSGETEDRVGLDGRKLLIDENGFSGLVSATNLITMENGKIGNWSFSLQEIAIGLEAGSLKQAGFRGQIHVPITKDDSTSYFSYSALIKDNGEYQFIVKQDAKSIEFDIWKANVELYQNSFVEIKKVDDKFLPKAVLHGKMTVNASLKEGDPNPTESEKKKGLKISGITFEDLKIQSVKPYVTVGFFSLGTEGERSETAKFPISIREIYGGRQGDDLLLGVDVILSLTNSDDGGFGAEGKIAVLGTLDQSGERTKYKFKGVQIDQFAIDVSKGPLEFSGSLTFFKEDPQYGNGINGQVSAKFGLSTSVEIKAGAIFGNVNGMRYWYVDAMAEFTPGIQAGPITLTGFGGGAFYRMAMASNGQGSPLGATQSGLVYQPDSLSGLGLKATVAFSAIDDNILNANATFEIAFRKGGGVRYISFLGNAYLMAKELAGGAGMKEKSKKMASVAASNRSAENPTGSFFGSDDPDSFSQSIFGDVTASGAPVSAHIFMMMNFEDRTFHANIEAYVNVAGGVIQGIGPNGRAGKIVIHLGPDDWYIYVGRPEYEHRVGVSVGVGPVRVRTALYLVMGTKIPGSPPPPSQVSEILGDIDLDYMSDLNSLGDGRGIGFGMNFDFDTGDLNFLIFYAKFSAGLGFDAMLKDYGETSCEGRSGKIGVNGWYANAQVYAYIQGKVGISVKLFRKRRKIDILDIGLAAVLQAQLPNPFWMKGIVGGKFRVLGGLVKGNCKFEFEIGDKCKIIKDQGAILDGIEVISQLTPAENSQGVEVFNVPQALFNLEVEKEFKMVDLDNKIRKFKVALVSANIKMGTTPLKGELKWNDENNVLAFFTPEVLPGEADLEFEVKVAFEEYVDGVWKRVKSEGEDLLEIAKVNFKTGKAPDYIPASNVANSFPARDQFNYYPQEYTKGHIKLIRGQEYLFKASSTWRQAGRYVSSTNAASYFTFTYSATNKEITYNMPSNLRNGEVYSLNIVNVPKEFIASVDQNVDSVVTKVDTGNAGIDLELKTQKATEVLADYEEKILYESGLRVSKYNTLYDKYVSGVIWNETAARIPFRPRVHLLSVNVFGAEGFSEEEQKGREVKVVFEADYSQNDWFKQTIKDVVYKTYNTSVSLGVADYPDDAIGLYQESLNLTLSNPASITNPKITGGTLTYGVPVHIYNDLRQLQLKAAAYIAANGGGNTELQNLMKFNFPVIWDGNYLMKIGFTIPGKGKTHYSSRKVRVVNPIVVSR